MFIQTQAYTEYILNSYIHKHTYMNVCVLCSCRRIIIRDVQVNKSKTWMIRKAHKRISVGTLETRCLLWLAAHKITNLWNINQQDIYMLVCVWYSYKHTWDQMSPSPSVISYVGKSKTLEALWVLTSWFKAFGSHGFSPSRRSVSQILRQLCCSLDTNHIQELTQDLFLTTLANYEKRRGKATLGFLVLLFRHQAFRKKISVENIMKSMINCK